MKIMFLTKNIIIFAAIFALIFFTGFELIKPQKVQAIIVHDPIHTAKTIFQTLKEIYFWTKDFSDKILRDAAVRAILRMITNETIKWVQGDGAPRFVSDWEEFLSQSYQKGANEFIEEIPADYICPEFRDELQRKLGIRFSASPRPSKNNDIEKLRCTLDKGEGWAVPQNNLYGAMTLIQAIMAERGASKAQAAQNEALASKGYISPKKCLESDDLGRCLKEIIVTPGGTVADVISRTLTSDIEYISNIQSVLGAVINAIISNLFRGDYGLAQMQPVSEKGWRYQGPEIEQGLDGQRKELLRQYQEMFKEEQAVLSLKTQSLEIAKQIRDNHCPYSGNIEAKINTLEQEVAELKNIISQLNNLISELNAITSDNASTQMPIAVSHYQDFMNNYGEKIQENIASGEARNNAQEELNELKRTQRFCSPIHI